MKTKLLLTIIFAGFIAQCAMAQITIDSSDIGDVGDIVLHAQDTLPSQGTVVTPSNTNTAQTWDYSGLNRHTAEPIIFTDPQNYSSNHTIQGADFVIPFDFGDAFMVKTSSSLSIIALTGQDFDTGFPMDMKFDDPIDYIQFPSTIGSTFSQTTTTDTTFEDFITGEADSIRIEVTFQSNSSCDAFGTLQTPDSTFQNTLRQYIKNTLSVSVFGIFVNPLIPDIPVYDTSEVTHTYNWYAQGARYPVLQAVTDQPEGQILSASYDAGNRPFPVISIENITCHGDSNGSIVIDTVYGNDSAYTYLWSNGSDSSAITGLTSGTYTVTVYGAIDSTVVSQTITEPDPIEIDAEVYNATGSNQSDGEIVIPSGQITGGYSPYLYDWSNGSIKRNQESIPPGNYTLTVTDDIGCTKEFEYDVNSVYTIAEHVSCHGGADGTATIDSAMGSNPPFSYTWPNQQSGTSQSNLSAGSYVITVTDDSGFISLTRITIEEPDPIDIVNAQVETITSVNDTNGSITIDQNDVIGGTPPYSFEWSNGSTDLSITNLSSGIYTLIVTDDIGCENTFEYEVQYPSSINHVTGDAPKPKVYPNPATHFVRIDLPGNYKQVRLFSISGKLLKTVNATNEQTLKLNIESLPNGVYLLKVSGDSEEEVLRFIK